MSKTIAISVTQEDIDKGVPIKTRKCPVGLAIKRVFPDQSVSVLTYTAFLGGSQLVGWPEKVTQFIRDFDLGRKVEPFTFTIEVDNRMAECAVPESASPVPLPDPEPSKKESHMRLGDLRALVEGSTMRDETRVTIQSATGHEYEIKDVLVSYVNERIVLVMDS